MKYIALTLLFTLSFFSLHGQEADPTPPASVLENKITRLLELSGAEAQFTVVIDQMIDLQKENSLYNDALSSDFWENFSAEIHKSGFQSLLPKMIELYKDHYTEDELDHQISYLSNPLTQKIVAKQPALMQASMAVGAEWGQVLAEQISSKLQQEMEEKN